MIAYLKKPRTWSRQLAFLMILGCAYLAYTGKTEALEMVVWPTVVFALPAYGFKQPSVESWMNK